MPEIQTAPPTDAPVAIESEATQPKSFGQAVRAAALCVAAAFCFYVLSAGPMSGLARASELQSFRTAVEYVYQPLIVIVKKDVRPFSTILRWYAGLFQ